MSDTYDPEAAAIHPHGYWLTDGGHMFDGPLCTAIVSLLQGEGARTVLDLGCGRGDYVRALNAASLATVGLDGSPWLKAPDCFVADLAVPVKIAVHDWVLCLEVGEHIPAQYETILLDNITGTADDGIILSWAIPGQGGRGHVNCRPNDWVKNEMSSRGFCLDLDTTAMLRSAAVADYFKNTLMVYRRK